MERRGTSRCQGWSPRDQGRELGPVMEVDRMLILTRKAGERIVIDGGITVTVAAIHGNRVKLGFEAPREVVIAREEAWEEPHVHDH